MVGPKLPIPRYTRRGGTGTADAAHSGRKIVDRPARRAAQRAGHGAERIATLCLRLKGYRILARRFLVDGGEIDIVAQRGDTIAFIEVKHRAALDDAHEAISPAKRRRIARAARVFVARQRRTTFSYRADAVFCAPWRWPVHVVAAFDLDL